MSRSDFRFIVYFIRACLVLLAVSSFLPQFADADDGYKPLMFENSTEGGAAATRDPAKRIILNVFSAISGRPGDFFVLGSGFGLLLALWKRRYRLAVGFLILISGVVILRVMINFLFGSLQ